VVVTGKEQALGFYRQVEEVKEKRKTGALYILIRLRSFGSI
jgi:hypothetical protein